MHLLVTVAVVVCLFQVDDYAAASDDDDDDDDDDADAADGNDKNFDVKIAVAVPRCCCYHHCRVRLLLQ